MGEGVTAEDGRRSAVEFRTIVVVGIGIIGGSLALAARHRNLAEVVLGVDTDADSRDWAVAHGVVDDALSPKNALAAGWFSPEGADLVVLATPALAAVDWLARLREVGYAGIVTDVASTKTEIVAAAGQFLGEQAAFVGGHPMAGSERSGVKAADANLFEGAYYVLTPTKSTDVVAYRKLNAFVSGLGARVVPVDARAHDEAVAVISHVPHVTAAALINVAAARSAQAGEDMLRLAAGGFKDMTRIAAGSPELWTGICLDNRDAVIAALVDLSAQLEGFAALLASGDRPGLRDWLDRAAQVRRALPARWVPASARLHELTVAMTDRPGAVSTVTQAAARAGCNIEDIGIDHVTEDTALLSIVLTDEGDVEALVAGLRADGFDVTFTPLDAEGQA